MKKVICCECNSVAVWQYAPITDRKDIYFCDEHVSRGCSCNVNYETGEELKDKLGRFLPCCEYNYNKKGFKINRVASS